MINQNLIIKNEQEYLDLKFKRGGVKKISIDEILEGLNEIPVFEERVKALQANSERSLNTILLYAFDGLPWVLSPEEIDNVKYNTASDDDQFIQGTNLLQDARRLYVFRIPTLRKERCVSLLTELLENLHPKEAEVLKWMMKGKLPYLNVDKKLVATAFPDLFPDYKEETKEEGKQREEKVKEAPAGSETSLNVSSPKVPKTPKKPAPAKTPKKPSAPKKPKKSAEIKEA